MFSPILFLNHTKHEHDRNISVSHGSVLEMRQVVGGVLDLTGRGN